MADEHVLRIEFEGDDRSQSRPEDQGAQQENNLARQETRREVDEFRRADESRQAYEDARSRFEDENYRTAANAPDSGPSPNPEKEEVDKPRYSDSRELVPDDPEFANISGAPDYAPGTTTEYDRSPVATAATGPAEAAGAAVDAAEVGVAAAGGGGGGVPPVVAAGAEAAAAGGAGFAEAAAGAGAAILAVAEPVAIAVAAVVGFAVAVVATTEALGALHDALLEQFEQVNGVIMAARAQQNVELIQKRFEVSQGLEAGSTATIAAQTEMEKQLIELNGHMITIIQVFLKPLYWIATQILAAVNWFLSWFRGPQQPVGFQQDAIDFLSNIAGNLVGQNNFRMKRPAPNPRRKVPKMPRPAPPQQP